MHLANLTRPDITLARGVLTQVRPEGIRVLEKRLKNQCMFFLISAHRIDKVFLNENS